jgi:hypothetical protein
MLGNARGDPLKTVKEVSSEGEALFWCEAQPMA